MCLSSQKQAFDKTGIEYEHGMCSKAHMYENKKHVHDMPKRNPFHNHVCATYRKFTSHYCGLDGHISTYCYDKLFYVPKGKKVWVPKGTIANHQGPKVWVPMK
jgi:hypothetical protein